MELNEKQRKESIKLWLSKEERVLVEAKAEFYGYKRLAPYVRDACIYENVTNYSVKYKEEIYEVYSKNTEEIKKILKELRHISRYATKLSSEELKIVKNTMFIIMNMQKSMLKTIDEKLYLNVWKKINHERFIRTEE